MAGEEKKLSVWTNNVDTVLCYDREHAKDMLNEIYGEGTYDDEDVYLGFVPLPPEHEITITFEDLAPVPEWCLNRAEPVHGTMKYRVKMTVAEIIEHEPPGLVCSTEV